MSENKKLPKTKVIEIEHLTDMQKLGVEWEHSVGMDIKIDDTNNLLHELTNFVKACQAICICPSYKSSTECTCKTYQWN